ncbi:MAG: class I SAM-dependent methyltransferase [Bacillota bacterium]|nr:class I SAM-dependent methyltransferase [Bacillota bacterium]MDP4170938.1 class I SAM-dependent methyltransferase [Bacillota bacterium]
MQSKTMHYHPALKYHWLTRFYDPFMGWVVHEKKFKKPLVNQANLMINQRILDLGCGTGTLTRMVKQAQPDAEVIGLDADPEILTIARKKAKRKNLSMTFQQGMSFELPYSDHSFDHVFSSLFFHHLTHEMKHKTLQEVFRILRPGGEIHVIDFEPQEGYLSNLFHKERFKDIRPTGRYKIFKSNLQSYYARKNV